MYAVKLAWMRGQNLWPHGASELSTVSSPLRSLLNQAGCRLGDSMLQRGQGMPGGKFAVQSAGSCDAASGGRLAC